MRQADDNIKDLTLVELDEQLDKLASFSEYSGQCILIKYMSSSDSVCFDSRFTSSSEAKKRQQRHPTKPLSQAIQRPDTSTSSHSHPNHPQRPSAYPLPHASSLNLNRFAQVQFERFSRTTMLGGYKTLALGDGTRL